jgi:ribonuclease P protein component
MYTFSKNERLCSKILIDDLLSNGRSFILDPFRIIWLEKAINSDSPAQVLINVSHHKFKRAVDRNRIKRLTREAYRKNKSALYEFLNQNNKQIIFTLFYISKDIPVYSEIELKIILILQRLKKEIEN